MGYMICPTARHWQRHQISFVDSEIFDTFETIITSHIISENYYCGGKELELELRMSRWICPGEHLITVFNIESIPILLLNQRINIENKYDKHGYVVDYLMKIAFGITIETFKIYCEKLND
jgi:hypothetical protein